MKRNLLTTYEASNKYGFSVSYIRRLLDEGRIKGTLAPLSAKKSVWLLEEGSLKKFKKTKRQVGRPRER